MFCSPVCVHILPLLRVLLYVFMFVCNGMAQSAERRYDKRGERPECRTVLGLRL